MPDLSAIEVMREIIEGLFLQEDALVTSEGVFEALQDIVSLTCSNLLELWAKRKANVSPIRQIPTRWADVDRKTEIAFKVIMPNFVPLDPKELKAHLNQVTRMRAASLDGQNKTQWDTMI